MGGRRVKLDDVGGRVSDLLSDGLHRPQDDLVGEVHRPQDDLVGEVHRLRVAFEGFPVTVLVLGEVDKDLAGPAGPETLRPVSGSAECGSQAALITGRPWGQKRGSGPRRPP
ncbi:unnamed protein product [Arctogadus glacialis]